MPISSSNGLNIYYEKVGTGPPLVLIHALPFDHHNWLYQVERFSSHFTTLSLDLRGLGRSSLCHEKFTLDDLAKDVLAMLADEGVAEGAILMGCSTGSKIALHLGCYYPGYFGGVVVVGGNSGPQPIFDERINSYRAHAHNGTLRQLHLSHLRYGVTQKWADSKIGRYLIAGFVERGQRLDSETMVRIFEVLTDSNVRPYFPNYRLPTLIINGEYDTALPGGTETAKLIHGVEHKIIKETGHCCFMEDPAEFNFVVQDFLMRTGLWPIHESSTQ